MDKSLTATPLPMTVAMATGTAVVASAAWYTALGPRLDQLDEACAEGPRPAAGVLLIEVS